MNKEFWVDMWAGWVGGAASMAATQPVDTVLTRMQALRLAPGVDGSARAVCHTVLSEGGALALWRGVTPMAFVVPMQNALLFAGYGAGERWALSLQKEGGTSGRPSLMPIFAGGVLGGVLQSFVVGNIRWLVGGHNVLHVHNKFLPALGAPVPCAQVSPFELIKIQQQKVGGAVPHAASALASRIGSGVLWRGLGATMLRDGLPHGVWFVSYEWSKRILTEMASVPRSIERANSEAITPTWVPLLSGAFAATVAWGVGYPFDTIKTRIQAAAASGVYPVPGMLETARAMVREQRGDVAGALYRGFNLKLLRAVPASAVCFFAYEEAKPLFEKLHGV